MENETISEREGRLLYLAVLVMVGILGVVIVSQWRSWQESGLLLGLLILFALVMARLPYSPSPRQMHLYLSIQTVILAFALFQHSLFVFLFFILSAEAMMDLPTRAGLRWLAVFAVITVVGNFVNDFDLWNDVITSLVNSAGFLFFGVFGNALMRAQTARTESQRLLAELQEAHQQLQIYAERVEELAVAEERNRLSREMHDTLGHRLTVSIVQLEGAGRLIEHDPTRAAQMVQTVREQLVEGLDELRRTLASLRNPVVAGTFLPQAIQKLADEFEQATHVQIHTDLPEHLPSVDDAQRHALYRTVQEALTNIQRHAGAQTVWLTLAVVDGSLRLTVRDDGRGLDPSHIPTGIGLHGIRERAAQLQGTFKIMPHPEGGTLLTLHFPLEKERAYA